MRLELKRLAAWLTWHALVLPAWWLCSWPERFARACGEAMVAEIFSCADSATARQWTVRALRTVYRLAQPASGSTRP